MNSLDLTFCLIGVIRGVRIDLLELELKKNISRAYLVNINLDSCQIDLCFAADLSKIMRKMVGSMHNLHYYIK